MRLFKARRLFHKFNSQGAILDFGCGTGELAHLLGKDIDYHFVEMDEEQVSVLCEDLPNATRHQTDAIPKAKFSFIFALDSLEHNENYPQLIDRLAASLATGGHLLVSGPTENLLYRIGRAIAGFTGEQHVTNIYKIETVLAERLEHVVTTTTPFGIPLFRISIWKAKSAPEGHLQPA